MSKVRSRVGFTPMLRSRSRDPRLGTRAGIALVSGLLLSVALAAPAPAAGDPRGINRTYEVPGFVGDAAAPVVALTFDDGPHPSFTPQILDILRDKGVQATFFMLGQAVERHPDLVRRVVAEGHIVAGHTWSHPRLPGLSEERFAEEIDRSTQVLEATSGQDVVCTRPPYGASDPATVARLAARGQASVVWSADSRDFGKPGADAIVGHSLEGLAPGGIILLHDGGGNRDQTIAALPRLIDEIRARGYSFVPVCDARPHQPEGHVDTVAGEAPESIRVVGWARDPDSADPSTVRITLDGAPAFEGPSAGTRADGHRGFDVTLPTSPGAHRICLVAVNVGLGNDRDLGCYDATALEAPWFDRLGRSLGLLEGAERWEGSSSAVPSAPLSELVDLLVAPR